MSEQFPGKSDDEAFKEIIEGVELTDVDLTEFLDDEIPIEAKLASDRLDTLPKIEFNGLINNWLELQSHNRRFVLYGISNTPLGLVCELTEYDSGSVTYVLLQGSYAIEGDMEETDALSQAYSLLDSTDDEQEPVAVALKNEEGDICAVVSFNNKALQRDSFLQTRPVYTLEGFSELVAATKEGDEPIPFFSVALKMPSGESKVFIIDISTLWFERIHRARLIREEDAAVIEEFGRVDSPDWKLRTSTKPTS